MPHNIGWAYTKYKVVLNERLGGVTKLTNRFPGETFRTILVTFKFANDLDIVF